MGASFARYKIFFKLVFELLKRPLEVTNEPLNCSSR